MTPDKLVCCPWSIQVRQTWYQLHRKKYQPTAKETNKSISTITSK